MAIRILTDSTSDILPQEGTSRGVAVVPLRVAFGDEVYRDGIDLDHETFFKKLVEGAQMPTTSQPTPEDFLPTFQQAKQSGDTLICILLSSAISGTVQSALIAKDICEYDDIHVVDSMQTVTGLRLLVDLAAMGIEAGKSALEIVEELESARHRVRLFAAVDTLTYLHRGGRLSSAVTVVGTLMKVKPLISFIQGKLEVVGKGLGSKGSQEKMLKLMDSFQHADPRLPLYCGYTQDRSQCEALMALVETQYHPQRMEMHSVGAVIGTHVGPKAAVVTYLVKE